MASSKHGYTVATQASPSVPGAMIRYFLLKMYQIKYQKCTMSTQYPHNIHMVSSSSLLNSSQYYVK